jgi:hypothetical protein
MPEFASAWLHSGVMELVGAIYIARVFYEKTCLHATRSAQAGAA